eukprot:10441879-Alexandrium_andersonii.AAC.1
MAGAKRPQRRRRRRELNPTPPWSVTCPQPRRATSGPQEPTMPPAVHLPTCCTHPAHGIAHLHHAWAPQA